MEDRANSAIQLGPFLFNTKSKAEEFIRGVLNKYGPMRPLADRDHDVALALLDLHPNRDAIVDCGIKEILVQWLDTKGLQRRFVVKRKDGSIRDFTWRHALYPRSALQTVRRICRSLIQDQIRDFRRTAFYQDIALVCPVSGQRITRDSCDVDHISPATFDLLVDGWLRSIGSTADDIDVISSREYQEPDRFQDEFLTASWCEYHRINAKLRVVSVTANRSILRRTKDKWKTPSLTPL